MRALSNNENDNEQEKKTDFIVSIPKGIFYLARICAELKTYLFKYYIRKPKASSIIQHHIQRYGTIAERNNLLWRKNFDQNIKIYS